MHKTAADFLFGRNLDRAPFLFAKEIRKNEKIDYVGAVQRRLAQQGAVGFMSSFTFIR